MERLTRKTMVGDYALEEPTEKNKNKAINRLGEIEDLEEELECSVLVIFMALEHGISYTDKNGRRSYYLGEELVVDFENKCFWSLYEGATYDASCDSWDGTGYYRFDEHFNFNDFGEKWFILNHETYLEIRKEMKI